MAEVNVTSSEQHRRPLTVVACLGVIGLLYVAYLCQSRSLGTDADGASNALQAWDMLHGNVLLRGWWLSDVSFYTTELPEYMLVELARGLNPEVINAAGAATYTLMLALAAVLAKDRATGTAGLLRALIAAGIMLAPGPGFSAATLLSSPDHAGTQVPLLLMWLAIDRLGGRRYLPWLVGTLLTWVEVADQMAIFVGALPVIVVSAIRIYQRRESWRADAGLLAGAVASVVLAMTCTLLIRLAGGFVVAHVNTDFAAAAQIPHHLWLTFESVLTLFGADFIGLRSWPAVAVAVLHLTGVILVAWACCLAGRRLLVADGRLVPMLFLRPLLPRCLGVQAVVVHPPSTATFLVLALTSAAAADGTPADATAQFGPAQRTARIGAYEVLVWNHNLLPALTGGFAPGCGQEWQR
jgi:hypothetical protein